MKEISLEMSKNKQKKDLNALLNAYFLWFKDLLNGLRMLRV